MLFKKYKGENCHLASYPISKGMMAKILELNQATVSRVIKRKSKKRCVNAKSQLKQKRSNSLNRKTYFP